MASLTGQSIASSYEQLLSLPDGGGDGTTLVDITDGDGVTTFSLKLAQYHAEIRGTTGTGATGAGKLNLSTAELTVVDNDVLGRIDFLAPLESSGTDAILAGASIWGEAEDTFAADNNSTALVFATNTSAAATERMRISSTGNVGIGTSSPVNDIDLARSAGYAQMNLDCFSTTNTHHGSLVFKKSANATIGNYEKTDDGESLGFIGFNGTNDASGGDESARGSYIYVTQNGSIGSGGTVVPSKMAFLNSNTTEGIVNMVLDANSRISLSNNDDGASNTIFGKNAGDKDGAGDFNVYIGELSGGTGTQTDASDANVGIGYRSLTDITTGYSNVAVGYDALQNATTGHNNVSIGVEALNTCTVGQYNIAIGRQTLYTDDEGNGTTAVGHSAGTYQNLSGTNTASGNSLFGYLTGHYNATGTNNTFIGYSSGYGASGQSNSENTAVGYKAMMDIQSGGANVAIGNNALENATTATVNTAVGGEAMGGITTNAIQDAVAIGHSAFKGSASTTTGANGTVAVGHDALKVLTTGASNLAVGFQAGLTITTTSGNTIVGSGTATAGTIGANNTVVGHDAFNANIDGAASCVVVGKSALAAAHTQTGTIAIGESALGSATSSEGSVAIGYQAASAITSGNHNTAIGHQAMAVGTTLLRNTVIGHQAMDDADAGSTVHHDNVFIGFRSGSGTWTSAESSNNTCVGSYTAGANFAGANNNTVVGCNSFGAATSGSDSVVIGQNSGTNITTGGENTIVGYNCTVASNDNTNNVIIGNNLTGTDKDNAVFIGNDTNHIENDFNADATWNYSSDIRQKTNIQDDTLGLSFINNLRTVTYKHKSPSEFPQEWSSYNPNDTEPMGGDKVIHGLIAQEVKKALDKQGIDTFSGWSVGDDGRQRISTEKMVLPLIKAVQELSAKVTELENKLK